MLVQEAAWLTARLRVKHSRAPGGCVERRERGVSSTDRTQGAWRTGVRASRYHSDGWKEWSLFSFLFTQTFMYVLSYCHAHSAWIHFSASFAVFLYLVFLDIFMFACSSNPIWWILRGRWMQTCKCRSSLAWNVHIMESVCHSASTAKLLKLQQLQNSDN